MLSNVVLSMSQGMRKPSSSAFGCVSTTLQVPFSQLLLVDDRQANVDAALQAGMDAIRFTGVGELIQQLQQRGIEM